AARAGPKVTRDVRHAGLSARGTFGTWDFRHWGEGRPDGETDPVPERLEGAMAGTIMVGVDGRAEHRAALEWATRRAVRDGARLEIVFVLERSWGDGSDGPDDLLVVAAKSVLATEREAALRIAEAASARVPALTGPEPAPGRRPVLEVGTRYLYGHIGAELESASRDADLLVVGARSRAERDRGFAGSLHVRVAAAAPCSVAVVPHGWADTGAGVVAGVDGKPPAEAAVAFAADEAAALGEPLRLVCV